MSYCIALPISDKEAWLYMILIRDQKKTILRLAQIRDFTYAYFIFRKK